MNPGLVYLLRKKPVGWWRVIARRAKGVKGLLLIIGAIFFGLILIGPQLFLMNREEPAEIASRAASMRLWGPPALMIMALFGMTSGVGLLFKRSEIDFLFPAPVGRRELLLYHLLSRLLIILLSGLWAAIFTLRFAPHWYGAVVGIFLALSFLHLTTQVGALLLSTVSMRMTKMVRRIALISILASLGLGVWLTHQQLGAEASLGQAARQMAESTPAKVIGAPARVFVEVFASESLAAFGIWVAAALAVLAVMFGLITMLDVAYTEGAVRISQQVEDRLRRMRSGGSTIGSATPSATRLSLPKLPWLGGAGPLAWRQGLEALRSMRGIGVMVLTSIAVPAFIAASSMSADSDKGAPAGLAGYIMIIVMTVFMTPQLALDFRRDLDRMEYLKSLPLKPAAIALGQILPATLIVTCIQLIACAVITLALGVPMHWPWPMLALLLPFNCLALALDNVLFLYFPHRIVPNEAGNVQFMGRAMLSMMLKMFALMATVGVAAVLGWVATLGGGGLLVAGLVAGLVLTVETVGALYWLGTAFRGFDPKDVPA